MAFSDILYDRKKQLIALGVIVVLSALGVGGYLYFKEPKPKSEKREDLIKFVASQEFKKLSLERQKYYTDKLKPKPGERRNFRQMRNEMKNLSKDEQRNMRDNMFRAERIKRDKEALAYIKMSKAEKEAFLDKRIAEWEQRRQQFEQRRRQNPQQQRRPRQLQQQNAQNQQKNARNQQQRQQAQEQRRQERTTRMRNMMENTPPEVRAAHSVMMRDMMERRRATGKMPSRGNRR